VIRGVLLHEALSCDTVRAALQHQGPAAQFGQQIRGHRPVVVDQIGFGPAIVGEEHLAGPVQGDAVPAGADGARPALGLSGFFGCG
jgi:hypothetical protein